MTNNPANTIDQIAIKDPALIGAIKEYKEGKHVIEICKKYNLKASYFYACAKLLGESRSGRKELARVLNEPVETKEPKHDLSIISETMQHKMLKALELYESGVEITKILDQCKIMRSAFYKNLRKMKYPLRKGNLARGKAKPLPAIGNISLSWLAPHLHEKAMLAIQLYTAGKKRKYIARKVKMSLAWVGNVIKKTNTPLQVPGRSSILNNFRPRKDSLRHKIVTPAGNGHYPHAEAIAALPDPMRQITELARTIGAQLDCKVAINFVPKNTIVREEFNV